MPVRNRTVVRYRSREHTVLVAPAALRTVNGHRPCLGEPEAGGILLGYLFNDRIEVIEAIPPNPVDKAGPFRFVRSKERAQQIIDIAWDRSDGRLNYVGEWHTHAENVARPSPQDNREAARTLAETDMEADCLVLLIQGMNEHPWIGIQAATGLMPLDLQQGD